MSPDDDVWLVAGFIIFLWLLATLAVSAAVAVVASVAAWTGGVWLWRRLHYWDRMVRVTRDDSCSVPWSGLLRMMVQEANQPRAICRCSASPTQVTYIPEL